MPEHTSFFSYLVHMFPALGRNMGALGKTLNGQPVTEHMAEPLVASVFISLLIVGLAYMIRGKLKSHEQSIIPDATLSLRTFFELLVGMFYDMMKGIMGPERAKRYFPVIGTCGLFILFANYLSLIPGILPPTASLRITLGMSLLIFLSFNYYGIKANGIGYFKHLCGPWLGIAGLPINILILGVEIVSLCVRPISLAMRLFLNMAVDHLLLSIFVGMVWFLVPVPILMLGCLVCIVQPVVFCLLSAIYIALATEHEEHGEQANHAGHASGHHA